LYPTTILRKYVSAVSLLLIFSFLTSDIQTHKTTSMYITLFAYDVSPVACVLLFHKIVRIYLV
jgi:hypothetical protein